MLEAGQVNVLHIQVEILNGERQYITTQRGFIINMVIGTFSG